jgi:TonB family protein
MQNSPVRRGLRPGAPTINNNATNPRPAGFSPDMKTKNLLLAAALAGGVLSSSAFAYSKQSAANEVAQLAAPVVTKVVHPAGIARRFEGATVRVTLTVDENGKPSDIRLVTNNDRNLKDTLIPAVAQWEFAPARLNGKAISAKVELPIQLLSDNS